jgi:hypothetical protein
MSEKDSKRTFIKIYKEMSYSDRETTLEYIKNAHCDGFYSYGTPCASDNSDEEAWEEFMAGEEL